MNVSKVSLLLYLLQNMTTELTFEKFNRLLLRALLTSRLRVLRVPAEGWEGRRIRRNDAKMCCSMLPVVRADKGTAAVSTQERARAGDATLSPPSIHGTCSRKGKKGRQKKRKGIGNNVKVVPGYIPRIVTDQGVDANKQQMARAVKKLKPV